MIQTRDPLALAPATATRLIGPAERLTAYLRGQAEATALKEFTAEWYGLSATHLRLTEQHGRLLPEAYDQRRTRLAPDLSAGAVRGARVQEQDVYQDGRPGLPFTPFSQGAPGRPVFDPTRPRQDVSLLPDTATGHILWTLACAALPDGVRPGAVLYWGESSLNPYRQEAMLARHLDRLA